MTEMKAGDITRVGTWGEYFAQLEQLTNYFVNGFMDKYAVASLVQFDISNEALALLDDATKKTISHINSVGNVHKTNKWQVYLGKVDNYFTATEEQAMQGGHDNLFITPLGYLRLAEKLFGDFKNRLHHQGFNPISTYGDNGYIPPDVYGSFEGSVSTNGGDYSCMLIEDDGTLVGLRYGTNGTTEGVYYFYKTIAENSLDGKVPVRTNYKYYPAGIPSGIRLGQPRSSCDNGVLIIDILDSSKTPNQAEVLIALTNGTLDHTKHYATTARIFDNSPAGVSRGSHSTSLAGVIVGQYVYIYAVPNGNVGMEHINPYRAVCWRVSIADIKNKSFVIPEHVTGWVSTGFGDNVRRDDHIKLADVISSGDVNAHSMVYNTVGPGTDLFYGGNMFSRTNRHNVYQHPTKPELIRSVHNTAYYYTDKQGRSYGHHYITIVTEIDVLAKTAKIINDRSRNVLFRDKDDKLTQTVYNNTDALKSYGQARNDWNNILFTSQGYLFCRVMSNAPESYPTYSRGKVMNFTNKFDMADPLTRNVINQVLLDDKMVLGSAITNVMSGALMHEDGYMTFYQTPSDQYNLISATDGGAGVGKTKLMGKPDGFSYKSVGGREDKGYAPTVDRSRLTSVAPGLNRICSEATADYKYKAHSLVLSSYVNNSSGCYEKLNSNLMGESPVSWSASEIKDATKQVIDAELGGIDLINIAGSVVIPHNKEMPCLMSCTATYRDPSGIGIRGLYVLVELEEPNSRTGNISKFKPYRTLGKLNGGNKNGTVGEHGGIVADFVTYQTKSGDILWAFRHTASTQTPGSSEGYVWTGYVPSKSKHVNPTDVKYYSSGYFRRQSMYSPVVIPNVGLALVDNNIGSQYNYCVMAARVIGDSVADFKSNAKWNTVVVLAAQQVEKGWLVYFTAETQLFMMGSEYTLPPTNIDLRNIKANPANTTFRLYVRLYNAQAEYYITTEELNPTMSLMYIGDIITDSTQIATINVDKRVRIDTFQISPVRYGSSIPVTTGVPSQEGTFAWK